MRHEDRPEYQPPGHGPTLDKGQPLHILVAEDNRINQQLAIACLEAGGHSVDVVDNGRQAVEAVRGRRYDAVLMDLDMPELGGLGAAAQIRALAGPPRKVPIIAFTASAEAGDRGRCLAAGMDDFIAKPFVVTALLKTLQQIHLNRRLTGE
jgi:CheY-like chemotaxis protein